MINSASFCHREGGLDLQENGDFPEYRKIARGDFGLYFLQAYSERAPKCCQSMSGMEGHRRISKPLEKLHSDGETSKF